MEELSIPSINDLKNQNNLIDENIDTPLENIENIEDDDLTASSFKKSLGKKVSEFTEDEKQKYNNLAQKKKRKKEKEIIVEKETIEEIKNNDSARNTLYNQLFVLKEKFPDGTKKIHIDPEMSYDILNDKKNLIMKLIGDKNADRVVFQSLLLLCRTGERGLNYMDVDLLDGFSEEVEATENDVLPILKEMVDMGSIDTTFLTPELRLMIVMSGVAVKTAERNLAKKKAEIVDAQ